MTEAFSDNEPFEFAKTSAAGESSTFGTSYEHFDDIIKRIDNQHWNDIHLFQVYEVNKSLYLMQKTYIGHDFSIGHFVDDEQVPKITIGRTSERMVLNQLIMAAGAIIRIRSVDISGTSYNDHLYIRGLSEIRLMTWGFEIYSDLGIGAIGISPGDFAKAIGRGKTQIFSSLRLAKHVIEIPHSAYGLALLAQWQAPKPDELFSDDEIDNMMAEQMGQGPKPQRVRLFGQKKVDLDI